MNDSTTEPDAPLIEIIVAAIECAARRSELEKLNADSLAREWLESEFDDKDEIVEWIKARCFAPVCAQQLDAAGITPAQAAHLTTEGARDYPDTIAYKFAQNDLTLAEARRIITHEFWKEED